MSSKDAASSTSAGRESLERLIAIIDHLPAMVAYWDRDQRNEIANAAYVDWFGLPGRAGGRARAPVPSRAEWCLDIAGSEPRDRVFHLTASPVRDAQGEVFAGTVVCYEVTAERRAGAFAHALNAITTLVATKAAVSEVVQAVAEQLRELFVLEQSAVVRGAHRRRIAGRRARGPRRRRGVRLAAARDGLGGRPPGR